MTERWVKVAGHERYIVSDHGRVRLGRVNAPILKGSYDKDGYHRASWAAEIGGNSAYSEMAPRVVAELDEMIRESTSSPAPPRKDIAE